MSARDEVIFCSYSGSEKYDFTWKVHNFSRQLNGVSSPLFFPSVILPLNFCLQLKFRVEKLQNFNISKFDISLKRCSEVGIPKTLRILPKVKLETTAEKCLNHSPGTQLFSVHSHETILLFTEMNRAYANCESQTLNPFFYSLSDDIIVVKCELELFGHNVNSISNISSQITHPHRNTEKSNSCFKTLYCSKFLSDLTIQIGKDKLKAHRIVLASLSPVFKCMLGNEWEESKSSNITITDVSLDIFELFLKYMYTGELEDKNFSVVMQLFGLADKYNVLDLKKDCREIIESNLRVDSVIEIMELAYLYSDVQLKNEVLVALSSFFGFQEKSTVSK